MADGWMVISHLEKNIADLTKVFYFPGYLVPWTLGHDLANESQPGWQKKRVKINWKPYEVRARMKQFNFLSGHGDAEDLVTWLSALNLRKWSNIMVVHGDVNWSSLEFKHRLERDGGFSGVNVIVPNIWESNSFTIDDSSPKKTVARKSLTNKKPATKKPITKKPSR
jgi:predicted metal-dependent RNase